jgi:hypothetical protein
MWCNHVIFAPETRGDFAQLLIRLPSSRLQQSWVADFKTRRSSLRAQCEFVNAKAPALQQAAQK